MKIAFFETHETDEIFFKTRLKGHQLHFFSQSIEEALTAPADFEIVSIFVHSNINQEILDKLPKLRYIQTRSTGFDHLNCQLLYKRHIAASNVRGYAGPAVAEFAFSLLLNGWRHTHQALARTKNGNDFYKDLKGRELFGKTIGILGFGTIGRRMAAIAQGFGMHVEIYSRNTRAINQKAFRAADLDTLLKTADVLMIALPLTPQTQGLLTLKKLQSIKADVPIINISRAEIIEDQVLQSLPNLFCIDVIGTRSLADRENILFTPHMAYYTQEALEKILEISLENMQSFIDQKPLPHALESACEKAYPIPATPSR